MYTSFWFEVYSMAWAKAKSIGKESSDRKAFAFEARQKYLGKKNIDVAICFCHFC